MIQWAAHHKDDSEVVPDSDEVRSTRDVSTWDEEFLNVNGGAVCEWMSVSE